MRERNIENLSKIQRLNLELQNLDEENVRTQDEIENIKKSLKTIEDDIDREKGIVIDANSNEKRLKEERNELIEIDSKYFETEKMSNDDLDTAKNLFTKNKPYRALLLRLYRPNYTRNSSGLCSRFHLLGSINIV